MVISMKRRFNNQVFTKKEYAYFKTLDSFFMTYLDLQGSPEGYSKAIERKLNKDNYISMTNQGVEEVIEGLISRGLNKEALDIFNKHYLEDSLDPTDLPLSDFRLMITLKVLNS